MLFARFAAVAAISLFFAGSASAGFLTGTLLDNVMPGPPSPALPGDRSALPAEQYTPPYTGLVPNCDGFGVLDNISRAFYWRELEFWHSGMYIADFKTVHEVGYRSNGVDYIPRRYCVARALFNDGHERTVKYQLKEDGGFFGYGYGVDWCVVGLDRNRAAAPGCQAVMP